MNFERIKCLAQRGGIAMLAAFLCAQALGNAENMIIDPDFAQPAKWHMPEGYKIEPGAGKDSGGALSVERTDITKYSLGSTRVRVTPGETYELGVLVKGENVKGYATLAGELVDAKGKMVDGGVYPVGSTGTFDWTLVRARLQVPPTAQWCVFTLYLRPRATGKAWFSQPYMRPAKGDFGVYLLQPAMPMQIAAGEQDLTFGILLPDVKNHYESCRVAIRQNDRDLLVTDAPLASGRLKARLAIPEGPFDLRISLLLQGRVVDEPQTIAAAGVPKGSPTPPVLIDDRGRARVNGQKFLPLGLFLNHFDGSIPRRIPERDLIKDLDLIAASPFNCVMPYDGLTWRMDAATPRGLAAVRGVLDYCQSRNLKVIMSVKDVVGGKARFDNKFGESAVLQHVVGGLKDHPALLAWYHSDEHPVSDRAMLTARSAFINQLDPSHPTWAVYCDYSGVAPQYGGTANVYGFDPYPISDPYGDKRSDNQALIAKAMDTAAVAFGHDKGLAMWAVPQIFNWGVYFRERYEKFQEPTEQQMRSMMLLELIGGAKGLVMYSFFDLASQPEPAKFDTRWPEICRVAETIKSIDGYILGDPVPPALNVVAQSGKVRAAAYANDDGAPAVLIAAIGPGPSQATIRVNTDRKLRSLFGRTVRQADGSWLFTGQNIDSDVLLPE